MTRARDLQIGFLGFSWVFCMTYTLLLSESESTQVRDCVGEDVSAGVWLVRDSPRWLLRRMSCVRVRFCVGVTGLAVTLCCDPLTRLAAMGQYARHVF